MHFVSGSWSASSEYHSYESAGVPITFSAGLYLRCQPKSFARGSNQIPQH